MSTVVVIKRSYKGFEQAGVAVSPAERQQIGLSYSPFTGLGSSWPTFCLVHYSMDCVYCSQSYRSFVTLKLTKTIAAFGAYSRRETSVNSNPCWRVFYMLSSRGSDKVHRRGGQPAMGYPGCSGGRERLLIPRNRQAIGRRCNIHLVRSDCLASL